jgi:hypothetical protein
MSTPVIALIGAGASYASGDHEEARRPPLTRQLFTTPIARDLLKTYSLARMAGVRIRRDMRSADTSAFEEALLRLRQSDDGHRRQMSLAVPLYLQALLMSYSKLLQAEAHRYEILVDELLSLDAHLLFVSLNYDTLLDNCLGGFRSLDTLEDYIDPRERWSLLKPHGSVNWFVQQDRPFDPTAPPEDLEVAHGPIQCNPARLLSLERMRDAAVGDETGATRRYPAIALPEGAKDELVLPPEHLDHLRARLAKAQELDLLVLGYSAIDTEILDLIKSSAARVRRMTVVNAGPLETLGVYRTISRFGIRAVWPDLFDGSYEQWIDGDGLRSWVQEFDGAPPSPAGPYPSLTEPRDLRSRVIERADRAGTLEGLPFWINEID